MIKEDPHQLLKSFFPQKDFFIGVDSDGCAFDTMEIKHKKCFGPHAIVSLGLKPISAYAAETWDFINLYSKTRGCNRFLGLIYMVDLLRERPEVSARDAFLPDMTPLAEWTRQETRLSNTTLEHYAQKAPHPLLDTALQWSVAVNASINKIVNNIPPFAFVRDSLEKLIQNADAMVVSSAPLAFLQREWGENGIDKYIRLLSGQEMGTKTEQLRLAASGKYEPRKILIIGDAPGDLKAARGNDALFYPILPGREEESWERFYKEGMDRFFTGMYAGKYQDRLLQEFDACLPSVPPWKR